MQMGGSTPNKPARRPAEMATADSPKDSEPPTVSGMPSVFYYITLREKCQTIVFSIKSAAFLGKKALDK